MFRSGDRIRIDALMLFIGGGFFIVPCAVFSTRCGVSRARGLLRVAHRDVDLHHTRDQEAGAGRLTTEMSTKTESTYHRVTQPQPPMSTVRRGAS